MNTKERLESCRAVRRLWETAYDAGRLPPIVNRELSPRLFDSMLLGALVQSATGDTTERSTTLGAYGVATDRWERLGAPTFQLTHNALAGFMLTDTSGLTWEEFRLPFPFFDVVLPGPNSPLVMTNENGGEVSLERISVGILEFPVDYDGVLSVEREQDRVTPFVHRFNELARRQASDAEFHALAASVPLVPHLWIQADGPNMTGLHRLFRIPSDPKTLVTGLLAGNPEGDWWSELNKHTMGLVCRVLMCLTLWLDGSGGKWEPSTLDKNRARGRTTCWQLGSEIKLPEPLREAAKALGRADRVPEPWSVQSRMLVKGHWKHQAHGPGRVNRKRIFIQPYWKGPEAGAVVSKLYTIGKENKNGPECDVGNTPQPRA